MLATARQPRLYQKKVDPLLVYGQDPSIFLANPDPDTMRRFNFLKKLALLLPIFRATLGLNQFA
jgi:hypothetical protein